MFNLFNVTTGCKTLGCKPRDATAEERNAYLRWIAERDGINIPAAATFGLDGIRHAGELIVAMPGYGETRRATMEVLDDDGNVIRSTPIAIKANGSMTLTKAQVQEATGLKPARASRKAKAVAPVEAPSSASGEIPLSDTPTDAIEVEASPAAEIDPIAAIMERLAAVEERLDAMAGDRAAPTEEIGNVIPLPVGDSRAIGIARARQQLDHARPKRTAAHARAIRLAWKMRREAWLQRKIAADHMRMREIVQAELRLVDKQRIAARHRASELQDKRRRAVIMARDARQRLNAEYRLVDRANDKRRAAERERDEARTALAASHARAERLEGSLSTLSGEVERIAGKLAMVAPALAA